MSTIAWYLLVPLTTVNIFQNCFNIIDRKIELEFNSKHVSWKIGTMLYILLLQDNFKNKPVCSFASALITHSFWYVKVNKISLWIFNFGFQLALITFHIVVIFSVVTVVFICEYVFWIRSLILWQIYGEFLITKLQFWGRR